MGPFLVTDRQTVDEGLAGCYNRTELLAGHRSSVLAGASLFLEADRMVPEVQQDHPLQEVWMASVQADVQHLCQTPHQAHGFPLADLHQEVVQKL